MGVRYVEHVSSVVEEMADEHEEMFSAMTKKATLPFLLSDNTYQYYHRVRIKDKFEER